MSEQLEWKKFSDEWPECKDYRFLWIYNGVKVSLYQNILVRISQMSADWLWAEAKIDYPAPPKKPFHYCEWDGFVCEEYRYHPGATLKIHCQGEEKSVEVICCPFCGYKLQGKE